MTLNDHVRFILPVSRELQFPAMAVVQSFVGTYTQKMQSNLQYQTGFKIVMTYELVMPLDDYGFFRRAQVQLTQTPVYVGDTPSSMPADMIVDISEEKLLEFYSSEKHACQVIGALCGVQCPPLPFLKHVKPSSTGLVYCFIQDNVTLPHESCAVAMTDTELMTLEDNQCMCFIGTPSWRTYFVASLGLPVIEIVDTRRPSWTSKWTNSAYRVIEHHCLHALPETLKNIHELLVHQETKAKETNRVLIV